jgi:hypothetical protein
MIARNFTGSRMLGWAVAVRTRLIDEYVQRGGGARGSIPWSTRAHPFHARISDLALPPAVAREKGEPFSRQELEGAWAIWRSTPVGLRWAWTWGEM